MRDGTETKARIGREAMRLFGEKGVHATSIKDIAEAAGIAQGALYKHYPGKDALVLDLFAEPWEGFARRLDAVRRDGGGFAERLGAMVRLLCRAFDADRTLFAFLFLVQHDQLKRLPDGAANPIDVLRTCIADAMAAGEIPSGDVELATAIIVGIVLQTATFKLYGRIPGAMAEACDALATACRRAVGA